MIFFIPALNEDLYCAIYNKIIIPNLEGNTIESISAFVNKHNLNVHIIEKYDEVNPVGYIISQEPKGQLILNDNLKLVVSKGSIQKSETEQKIKVPDFIRSSLDIAFAIADRSNLVLEVCQEYNDRFPAGEIISQRPLPNEEVEKKSIIVVTVSKGVNPLNKKVKVPNFVGMKIDTVIRIANAKQLSLEVEKKYHDYIQEGEVLSQSIEVGEEVLINSTIKIFISQGIEKSLVPNLINMNIKEAENELKKAKLSVAKNQQYDNNSSEGMVIDQDPKYGQFLNKGEIVTLTISLGQEPLKNLNDNQTQEVVIKHDFQAKPEKINVAFAEWIFGENGTGLIVNLNGNVLEQFRIQTKRANQESVKKYLTEPFVDENTVYFGVYKRLDLIPNRTDRFWYSARSTPLIFGGIYVVNIQTGKLSQPLTEVLENFLFWDSAKKVLIGVGVCGNVFKIFTLYPLKKEFKWISQELPYSSYDTLVYDSTNELVIYTDRETGKLINVKIQ